MTPSGTSDTDAVLAPGAMQVVRERDLPSGHTVRFEFAPAGSLTLKGRPRLEDWRRYFVHVTGQPVRRQADMFLSVTTLCDQLIPKPGLNFWYERGGIEGACEAMRAGLITPLMAPDDAVAAVRRAHLGADALRDRAADRGLNVHHILEVFMTTGEPPNPADHPEAHRPFIRGLIRWLLHANPEPVAVELLVADPERGYAGRCDLIARIHGTLTIVDLKTQERGGIYPAAHVQTRLYWDAETKFGEHRPAHGTVVVVDGHGTFREMDVSANAAMVSRALAFFADLKPLVAGCEQQNQLAKDRASEAEQEA